MNLCVTTKSPCNRGASQDLRCRDAVEWACWAKVVLQMRWIGGPTSKKVEEVKFFLGATRLMVPGGRGLGTCAAPHHAQVHT